MAKKSSKQVKQTHQPNTRALELRVFTTDFFSDLGATVIAVDQHKTGALQVELPEALATYFGSPSLTLGFQQAGAGENLPREQLVAHGSPLFDKMLAYLDHRSAVTHQRLPVRHSVGEELMRAVRPVNTGIVGLRMGEQSHHLYAFHWHITYRADDKREELYSVLLDEAGERLAIGDDDTPNPMGLAALLADAEPLALEAKSDERLHMDAMNGVTVDVPGETPGLPIIIPTVGSTATRLPPMTQLSRLAETARKYAIYHADLRCVSHEAEILPRLYKTLNRLTTYYQQQIEEVYDAHDQTGEKRRALEADLERKLAEEVENHRLRVGVQLFSYAVLQVPVAVADITLSDGKREVSVQVLRNRYDGTIQRPRCYVCQAEMSQVALDHNGHLFCDACLHQCGSCQEILCTTCGVAACPVCGQENCDTCGRLCWACGERACAAHSSLCPVCGDEVCHACQELCAHCGVRQCRSHLRIDQVKVQAGVTAYICAGCALHCPGCQQYSAEIGSCSASGQRFCQSCLVNCTSCQRSVGPGFYQRVEGQAYCQSCLVECPSCRSWALTVQPCPQCQTAFCAACGATCTLCQERFCPDHSYRYADCSHIACHAHAAHCHLCQEELCPICEEICAICERYHCTLDEATCKQCGRRYCQGCVGKGGVCTTCTVLTTAVFTGELAVDLTQEPCFTDSRVAKIVPYYVWTRGQNQRYTIYLGRATGRRDAHIVTTTNDKGLQILAVTGQGTARARQPEAAPTAPTKPKEAGEWLHEFQEWLRRMRRSGRGR